MSTPPLASTGTPGEGMAQLSGRRHALFAGALMLACLALSIWMKPTVFWSDSFGEPDFNKLVPQAFGDWILNPYGAQAVVNPQQEEAIRAIYDTTMARTYIHKPTGRQIMVSLAYGKDQSRDTQLHAPEACYGGNGFRIDRLVPEDIRIGQVTLPAMRMDAVMGLRHEYVTYWMRVGDGLARGSLERNLVRMQYASRGYIVDGMLFRVSEVTRAKPADSYRFQDDFLRDFLPELRKTGRIDQFVGKQAL